jgi:hypothetical protein
MTKERAGVMAEMSVLPLTCCAQSRFATEGRSITSRREIWAIMAEDYLAQHPELVAKAKEWATDFLAKRRR